jgi:hypothetical protein
MAGKKKRNNKNKNQNKSDASGPLTTSNGGRNGVQVMNAEAQEMGSAAALQAKEASPKVTGVSVQEIREGLEEVAKVLANRPALKEMPAPIDSKHATTLASCSADQPTETPKTSTSSESTPIDAATIDNLKASLKDIIKPDELNTPQTKGAKKDDLKTIYNSVVKTCEASETAATQPDGAKSRESSFFANFEEHDPNKHLPPRGTKQTDGCSISQLSTPEICARAVSNVRRELADDGTTSDRGNEDGIRHDSKQRSKAERHAEAQKAIHPLYRVDFKPGWDAVYDPNHLLPCNALKGGQDEAEAEKEGVAGAEGEEISPRSHKARPASVVAPNSPSPQDESPRKARPASTAYAHPLYPSSRAERLRRARSGDVRTQSTAVPSCSNSNIAIPSSSGTTTTQNKRHGQYLRYWPPPRPSDEDPDAITPAPLPFLTFYQQIELLEKSRLPNLGLTVPGNGEGRKAEYEDVELNEDEPLARLVDKVKNKEKLQYAGKGTDKASEGMQYEKQPADAEQDDDESVIGRFAKWWGECVQLSGAHREDEPPTMKSDEGSGV